MKQKEYVRVKKAQDEGAIFFIKSFENKPYELRLEDERLTYMRLGPGSDDPSGRDTQIFVLKRLNKYKIKKRKIRFAGEFYFMSTDKRTYSLKEEKSIIRHANIGVRRPLENEEKLLAFLEYFLKKSESIQPTSRLEIIKGWTLKALPWIILMLILITIKLIAG